MRLNRFLILLSFILTTITGCSQNQSLSSMNRLSSSESPYLLQHKNNPVHWQPWDQAALNEAQEQDKLLIISIGYSSCHWCHVMEHESFEDNEVAEVMNSHFVSIKVDREERPDIDQVYMSAVQLMTGRGGWPLNCIALPDGRPVYGGTYFSKEQWIGVLNQLSELYANDRAKMLEYAQKLQDGMEKSEMVVLGVQSEEFPEDALPTALTNWRRRMDDVWGGPDKAPKFPLPNNYLLALELLNDERPWLTEHIKLTLDKMAVSGIYDQAGGGFARYSTDKEWKVPHFEKMLYDNGQLISLYSRAYKEFRDPMYLRIAKEIIEWCEREMKDVSGLYYSALDADSEGEEGLFYTWSETELNEIRKEHPSWRIDEWFNLDEGEEWEGRFILQRRQTDTEWIESSASTTEVYQGQWNDLRQALLELRERRVRPGLDNKVLCSWNALLISGFCQLYEASSESSFRDMAIESIDNVLINMYGGKTLNHAYINGSAYGDAMLDDYAFLIRALMDVHRVSGKEDYLTLAFEMTEVALEKFNDDNSPILWFSTDSSLVVRTKETEDNVIPAANSQMARNLHDLGLLYGDADWIERSKKMLLPFVAGMESYPEGYSNWGILLSQMNGNYYELAIIGDDAEEEFRKFSSESHMGIIPVWSDKPSDLPIFKDRWVEGKTLYYLCEKGACQMPQESWAEVRMAMSENQ
jgi:uncharacterized protein YyaL (SSP411 family)